MLVFDDKEGLIDLFGGIGGARRPEDAQLSQIGGDNARYKRAPGLAVLLALAGALAAPAAAEATTTWTTLQVPGTGATEAFGINDSGEIVGASNTGGAFLLRDGTYTTLVPGAATGINDSGDIVGYYSGGSSGPCPQYTTCGFRLTGAS